MPKEAEKFIQGMGFVAQADGLPRIAGSLIGLMVLEEGPFSFSALATRLAVSRASISTNTRLLEKMGVIERIGGPKGRQHYFQLTKNPYTQLLQGLLFNMNNAEQLVASAQKDLPKGAHQKRLKELRIFYHEMIKAYRQVIKKMEDGR